jgi:hypothetical protein
MNILLDINKFSFNNIFFNDAIKNTVINDSDFIRLIYSNKDFILNGLFFKIDLINCNSDYLNKINTIEKSILDSYNIKKHHNCKIVDQLNYIINKSNNSNLNSNLNNLIYILKISGIWETNMMIGITYKLIDITIYP